MPSDNDRDDDDYEIDIEENIEIILSQRMIKQLNELMGK